MKIFRSNYQGLLETSSVNPEILVKKSLLVVEKLPIVYFEPPGQLA